MENDANFDILVKQQQEMVAVLQDNSKSQAELKEAQEKMKAEMAETLGHNKSAIDKLNEKVEALTKEKEQAEEDIFNKILGENASKDETKRVRGIGKAWNIHSDSFGKSLYTPSTKFVSGFGWKNTGSTVDKDLAMMNDFLYMYGLQKSAASIKDGEFKSAKDCMKELVSFDLFQNQLKAMATTNVGEGLEWVPTQMSGQMIDDIRMDLMVGNLFRTITMPDRTGAWELPYNGDELTAYLVGESLSNNSTKIPAGGNSTAKITISAVKHAIRLLFSYEMDEDAIINLMPLIMDALRESLVRSQEYAIINGDDSATHMDSDVTSAFDAQKSWKGLRYYSGNGSDSDSVNIATLNLDNLRAIRKGMGKYGVKPSNLDWVAGISGYIQMLGIDEVITMDKFGNDATVKKGTLAMIDGSSVTVTEAMREDLNALGVHDGTTTTKTEILCVNNKAFMNFEKPSGVRIENARDIETQQDIAVASRRLAFQKMITAGTDEKLVNVGYNLAS